MMPKLGVILSQVDTCLEGDFPKKDILFWPEVERDALLQVITETRTKSCERKFPREQRGQISRI